MLSIHVKLQSTSQEICSWRGVCCPRVGERVIADARVLRVVDITWRPEVEGEASVTLFCIETHQ